MSAAPAHQSSVELVPPYVCLTIELSDGPKIDGNRPAIDVTLQSVTQTCGARATGILLTGMGEDGAEGLSLLRKKGGTTFAQSEESCIVFGMPKRAIELDAAQHIGSPQEIGRQLAMQVDERSSFNRYVNGVRANAGANAVVATAITPSA